MFCMFFLFVLLLLCAVPLLWYNMGQIIKSLQFVDLCLSVCLSVCGLLYGRNFHSVRYKFLHYISLHYVTIILQSIA